MTTKISSQPELKRAAATLHDARFTADAIKFDVSANVFTLKCWIFEPAQNKGGNARRWRACRLSFTGVTNCDVTTHEKVCYYELSTVRLARSGHRLDLITHYGIQLVLQIRELNGVLTETDEMRERWN